MVTLYKKMGNIDGSVLCLATNYYSSATYHLNLEAITFAVMRAGATGQFEILNLDIIDGGLAIVIT